MANKKINQLVSKTAILSTDIFGIGDATTGQLFKKTIAELQAAIGGAVISVNGLVGTVVLDTDDIQELATPTNKYFTDARARGAISLTVTGNSGASTYSSGTGVLNVPTYTLAGLGGISATFLSGTSGISYNSTTGVISYSGTVYTDASIRALLSGSTGISYNSTTGAISYSGTVYTDASVRALISITTTGTSGASTYNNTTGVINVPNYTLAGLGGISYTSLSGGTGITYNNTTGAISYSGTVYTDASVRALVSAGTGLTYNSSTGVFTSTITQYTDALARASISITTTGTSGASTYNSTTGVLNVPQYQGAITLTTTGTSGAATFSSNTLNIPQYQSVLTNPVTGTGTTNYHAKFTSSSAIGNSLIFDNGTNLGIATSGGTYASTTLLLRATSATSTNYAFIIEDNATNEIFSIQNSGALTIKNAGTTRLTIASTGAATFSGNIAVGGGTPSIFTAYSIASFGSLSTTSNGITIASTTTGNGLIEFADGTTGNQAYRGYLQYAHTADSLSFGTAGSDRMIITSAGNVGIGTSSPLSLGSTYSVLTLNGSNGSAISFRGNETASLQLFGEGVNGYVDAQSTGSLIFRTTSSYTERMRITSGGNVGIGTSSPGYPLDFGTGGTGNHIRLRRIYANGSGTDSGYSLNNTLIYQDSGGHFNITNPGSFPDTSLRITTNGNTLLGTTSDNGERLYVSGSIRATGTITANSDLTLKKNLLRIENALEKVEQINGYTYEFKEDDSKRHAGVIAQEIQTVLPEIVNKGNDGILGVEYGNISALLIEAIKEQQTQINELKALLNK